MQNQLQNNPEMMRQLMNNPLIQQMMDNPETIRTLMMNIPEVQAMVERNPDLNHMLNNPALLRQCAEIMRNPAMVQEFTRNSDRAMSNLESLPGGFNALQRMYNEMQVYNIKNSQCLDFN